MKKVPAISIGHAKDRIGLFTIVVLGEITFSLLIDSTSVNAFLISVCGLVVASRIQYIYFKTESETNNIEQVRGEHRVYAPVWFFMHLPLQCAIALSGASLGLIVSDTVEIEDPTHFLLNARKTSHTIDFESQFSFAKVLYFSCLSMIMFCLSVMSMIHMRICEKPLLLEWKQLTGSFGLFFIFLTMAIICKFVYLEIFFVSGLSAILMIGLSAVEEWEEAAGLWKSK